jgi:hypothetical protein
VSQAMIVSDNNGNCALANKRAREGTSCDKGRRSGSNGSLRARSRKGGRSNKWRRGGDDDGRWGTASTTALAQHLLHVTARNIDHVNRVFRMRPAVPQQALVTHHP